MGNNCILSSVSRMNWGGLQGGRHYVESSGSDLMVFFSALLGARCDVPFSEEDKEKAESLKFLLHTSPSKAPPPPNHAWRHTPAAGVLLSSALLLLLLLWL